MKYYTKEWYELMQNLFYTEGFRKIPDRAYSEAEIQAFYDKARKRFVAEERRYALEEQGKRKPLVFDAEEAASYFDSDYRLRLRYEEQGLPAWARGKADRRLLALGLMPESLYSKLQSQARENRRKFRAMEKRAEKALAPQRELIPSEIREALYCHDDWILSLKKQGRDIVMLLCKGESFDDDGTTPYEKILFRDAAFLEREKGLRIRPRLCAAQGIYESNCTYLYEELYKTAEGYEIHLLLEAGGLRYVTVRCRGVEREQNVRFERE